MGRVLLALLLAAHLGGCGFHLRGASGVALPESLERLRVIVEDSKLANDLLLVTVKIALQSDPKVTITEATDAPALILSGERTGTQVLSVSTSGRASGYTLRYEVSFRLIDARGRKMLEPQTVKLLRDYTFDPLNVLAKQQEEQDLKRAMQRDAVQQILRRLARVVPPAKTSGEKAER